MAGFNIEEGLDPTQLRRYFLPGLVAAVGLYKYFPPASFTLPGFALGGVVVFVALLAGFGFLLTTTARPIFYLYEGFRLPILTRMAFAWNRRRVARWQNELNDLYGVGGPSAMSPEVRLRASKLNELLLDFPVQQTEDSYDYEVERPTRVGNIIASYELYPERRYGIDGVSYWFHLTGLAPDAVRDDFYEKAAQAESLLLSSAAGAGVSLVAGAVLGGRLIGKMFPSLALWEAPVGDGLAYVSLAFGLCAYALFYRLSWPAFREAGQSFRALVDLAMPEFKKWLHAVDLPFSPDLARKARATAIYAQTLDFDQSSLDDSATQAKSTPQVPPQPESKD